MFTKDGPFYGGFSAELVIDNYPAFSKDIIDGFKSIVGVATRSYGPGAKLKIKLVSTENGALETLSQYAIGCVNLPIFIFPVDQDPPIDIPPQPIG